MNDVELLEQVLLAAEAAFKDATGLESVRGVALADSGAELVGRLDPDSTVLEDCCDALETRTKVILKEVEGIEAPSADLLQLACEEVLDAAERDRPLNPGYWYRAWGPKAALPLIKELAAGLADVFEQSSNRFEHQLDAALVVRGYRVNSDRHSDRPIHDWMHARQAVKRQLADQMAALAPKDALQALRALKVLGDQDASEVLDRMTQPELKQLAKEHCHGR